MQGSPQAADHHRVLGERGEPVGKRFRRGVDQHPGAGLGGMGAGRQASAQDAGGYCHGRGDITNGPGRQQGAGWDPDKGVDRIPAGVNPRYLVGAEFHQIHDAGRGDHHRVHQHLQVFRQYDVVGDAQDAQNQDGGIEVDAAGPGHAHG